MSVLPGISGSLLVLALALTGCGGDGSDRGPRGVSSGGTVNVCELLTPADLEATFGGSFDEGEPTHDAETGADVCVWTSDDASGTKTFSATVLRQDGLAGSLESSGMSLAELFAQARDAYPNAEALDLGDEAYAAVSEVQVLDGETWYSFSAYLGAETSALDGLKELAVQVVG